MISQCTALPWNSVSDVLLTHLGACRVQSISPRYLSWAYILVALAWLTPAAFLMLPAHALEILVAKFVFNYELEGNDVFMILFFGIPHILQVRLPILCGVHSESNNVAAAALHFMHS